MVRSMNMRKIGAVLLAAGTFLSVSGCSGAKGSSVQEIKDAGVFKVAIVDTSSQYTSLKGNTPVGVEPELIESISSALGVPTKYQVVSRAEALKAVVDGSADIAIGCINDSSSLTENHLLSTSYGKGFFYAVTKKGDYAQTIGSFADSALGTAGNLDEETRTQLYRADGVTVSEYAKVDDAAEDIKSGKIRAYICYENQAAELLEDPELQVQNLSNLEPEEFVIVAGKEDQALVSGINTLIEQFLEKE